MCRLCTPSLDLNLTYLFLQNDYLSLHTLSATDLHTKVVSTSQCNPQSSSSSSVIEMASPLAQESSSRHHRPHSGSSHLPCTDLYIKYTPSKLQPWKSVYYSTCSPKTTQLLVAFQREGRGKWQPTMPRNNCKISSTCCNNLERQKIRSSRGQSINQFFCKPYHGVPAGDMDMSGSGKLNVTSRWSAAVGVKLLIPYTLLNILPNELGLGKPEGLGSPNEEGENRRLANVGDKGGGWAPPPAVAPGSCFVATPWGAATPSATACASCLVAGDSNPPVRALTQPWSLGDNWGKGEKERGDIPNGDAPCFESGEKLPNVLKIWLPGDGGREGWDGGWVWACVWGWCCGCVADG